MKKSCLLLALLALFVVACAEDEAAPKAPNLALASLTVSSGTLTPAFDPAVTAYTVSVSNTVTNISVTGIATDAQAVVSYDPTQPAILTVGSNLITVHVASADLRVTNSYRVVVQRAGSDNAALAGISLSAGILVPGFNTAVTNYTVDVDNAVSAFTVTATAVEPNAAITYDPIQPSVLTVGSNLISVRVVSQSGLVTNTYTVVVLRDPALSSLATSAGTLVPVFSSNVYVYALNVGNAAATLTLAADAAEGASVSYTPAAIMALSVGSNYATVTVTAQDGTTTKEYRVVIRRNGATPSDLTSPTVSGITLKGVPAGAFQRDATAGNTSYVSAFRISQTEITRAQFNTVMGSDPSQTAYSSGTGDPVQYINWYHAIAFCNKLSIRDGLGQVYSVSGVNFSTLTFASIPTTINADWIAASANWSATGYRLPTEMEWQWAAMGAMDARAKAFAGSTGSNSIGDYAWYSSNSSGKTHPVGSKLPNELGLSDMSGNVWEWCWDWWAESYPAGYQADYRGAASGTSRVKRGGSWNFVAPYCAVVSLIHHFPTNQNSNLGFRVVRP